MNMFALGVVAGIVLVPIVGLILLVCYILWGDWSMMG